MRAPHSLVSRELTSPEGARELARGIEGGLSQVASPCAGAALDLPAPATRPTLEQPLEHDVCAVITCLARATTVLRFRSGSHSHTCDRCTAHTREFHDVVWSGPMPCTLSHGGGHWATPDPL